MEKKRNIKKGTALLTVLICLTISGCGESSKDQIITIYDYSENKLNEYDTNNKEIDDLVNSICDYLLDEDGETVEIPKDALNDKRIEVFQGNKNKSVDQQKTNENRLISIEIYKDSSELYCKAYFSFSEQEYSTKLPADITKQVEELEISQK